MIQIKIEEKQKKVEATASGDMRAHTVQKDRSSAVIDVTMWLEDWARREGETDDRS